MFKKQKDKITDRVLSVSSDTPMREPVNKK